MCKHSTPSSDFTDFTAWLTYQFEAELEGRRLLLEWEGKKQVKIAAGKPALIETTEVSRYTAWLLELESNIRLGALIEGIADTCKTGRLELGSPILRFYWSG